MVDSPKTGSKIMADFRKGKKNGSKKLGASWKILGVGMKGATGLREILLIAFFFADGPAETHKNSSNFGSENLATPRFSSTGNCAVRTS